MKNYKQFITCFAVLFAMAIAFNSCEKVQDIEIEFEEEAKLPKNMLEFNSLKEFTQMADSLNNMSFQNIEKYGEEHSFISQDYLFRKLIILEDEYEESIINEYGITNTEQIITFKSDINPHCDFYYELLEKGMIIEEIEDDGSSSYRYSVINPAYMSVINANGLVKINNQIYQYYEDGYKIIHDADPNKIDYLEAVCETNKNLGITVVDLNSFKKGYGFSFDHDVTKTDGNWKRVRFRVYFHQGDNGVYYEPASCFGPQFFVYAIAEKKSIFGNWRTTNNYLPIDRITGSWTYRFKVVRRTNYSDYYYDYDVDDSDSKESPFVKDDWGGNISTNYYTATCTPDGQWFCAPNVDWLLDELKVYNYDFYLDADGYSDWYFND